MFATHRGFGGFLLLRAVLGSILARFDRGQNVLALSRRLFSYGTGRDFRGDRAFRNGRSDVERGICRLRGLGLRVSYIDVRVGHDKAVADVSVLFDGRRGKVADIVVIGNNRRACALRI